MSNKNPAGDDENELDTSHSDHISPSKIASSMRAGWRERELQFGHAVSEQDKPAKSIFSRLFRKRGNGK